MSRLESFLRRLTAQRDGLNWAASQITGVAGDALELGLGNGRSYDHMRATITGRRIWVIDRALNCHPSCTPPAEDFLEGDARDMLCRLFDQNTRLAIAHYDFGIGVRDLDVGEATALSPFIARVMAPGGVVMSSQPLVGFFRVDGPQDISPDRYWFYRT